MIGVMTRAATSATSGVSCDPTKKRLMRPEMPMDGVSTYFARAFLSAASAATSARPACGSHGCGDCSRILG